MREFEQLFGLASSWPERLQLAQFLMKLCAVRALPWASDRWDSSIRLGGSDYTVGLRTSDIYVLGDVFRHRPYDRLGSYVPKDDWIVFDVGAKVGIVSVLAAQLGAWVYAFEPNPDCHRRLVKNVRVNHLHDRVYPYNLAVSDEAGWGSMQRDQGRTTADTLSKDERSNRNGSSRVNVTTLDRIASTVVIPRIDLLKIDVEGAEVDVLLGGARALEVTQRIIVECHSRELLRLAREILVRSGFVCEQGSAHFPEEAGSGQPEVVVLYAARPSVCAQDSPSIARADLSQTNVG